MLFEKFELATKMSLIKFCYIFLFFLRPVIFGLTKKKQFMTAILLYIQRLDWYSKWICYITNI
jgi:hypothetical protein